MIDAESCSRLDASKDNGVLNVDEEGDEGERAREGRAEEPKRARVLPQDSRGSGAAELKRRKRPTAAPPKRASRQDQDAAPLLKPEDPGVLASLLYKNLPPKSKLTKTLAFPVYPCLRLHYR
ncbi:hypothetical protein NE237_025988 [Protea cynaroides]|uniref:Uncharacterized protein n=1 Tax=Protea cynaroides TaxID=273540 RepID=A0A9Q0K117_9MAGN|nr:hypothetical protein NE237_025988 [Protea cynaroides]